MWKLYSKVVARIGAVPTVVKWDNDVPDWSVLAAEAARADAILTGSYAMQPDEQAAYRQTLRDGRLPPGVTAVGPVEAARRFSVYRNNVAASLGQARARRFSGIERLVGPEFFGALAQAYLAADPPRTPVLAEWGAGFATF